MKVWEITPYVILAILVVAGAAGGLAFVVLAFGGFFDPLIVAK